MNNELTYHHPRFTDKELLEIFPEAKEIIPLKIKECKAEIKEKEQEITTALKRIYALKTDKFSEWFGEEVLKKSMMPDLEKLEKTFFRLNHMQSLLDPDKQQDNHYRFEEKIETARQYPVAELARSKLELRQAGRNFISLCPFHNEKTPSFYIYTDSGRFHCFGCNQSGDVINLTMTLYGIEFKEAVEMLQN